MENIWNDLDYPARKNEIVLDKENLLASKIYKKAKDDIRETDSIRSDSLVQFRNWIHQNPDIENCITDDSFLLRFLRVRKYSVPMAEQTLLKYLNFRQTFSHALCNLDYTEERVSELINSGYIFTSPFRDRYGRRVVFYNLAKIDLGRTTGLDVQRADALTFETLIDEPENQVMGITHIIIAGAGPAYIPFFMAKDFGYLIKWGQQSFPMRHREVIIINVSPYVKYIYDVIKRVITPKLRNRICFDDSLEKLQEKLGKNCLPLEMGGTVPEKEMMQLFQEELAAKRERILSYDKINLLNNNGIITRKTQPTEDNTGIGSVQGSFRKLNID